MHASLRKVLIGATFFTGSCLAAVIGYVIAGWDFLDAIYMVTITIFGVGYSEVRPIDEPALRVLTMCVIVAGCTSSIYVMGGFVQMIAAGELNRYLGTRRMTRGIERLTNHVIVCGYGRVGRILVDELAAAGLQFVIIDTNTERLQEAETAGRYVVIGDAAEERVLQSARISEARVVATVLPDDATNVFITLTARELNPSAEIIARAQSPSTEKKLLRSGATQVVLPAAIGATRIARMITRTAADEPAADLMIHEALADDLEHIGLRVTELPISEESAFVGRYLSELTFADSVQYVIIAVRSCDGTVTRDPAGDYVLAADDVLMLLAHRNAELRLVNNTAHAEIIYRGARS